MENNQTTEVSWKDSWKRDIKLSYTESATRPHRINKDDAEHIQSKRVQYYPYLQIISESVSDNEAVGEPVGALADRNAEALVNLNGEPLPLTPDVLRLHFELDQWWDEEDIEDVRKYAGMKGNSITRDVVAPADIPLYAVHYLIQRLFGWQNSHLHQFEVPWEDLESVTEKRAELWNALVGIVFRSPMMAESDLTWAENRLHIDSDRAFKSFLTDLYTGPYRSLCRGESFIACRRDMADVNEEEEVIVCWALERDDKEYIFGCVPVLDRNGKEIDVNQRFSFMKEKKCRYERMKFKDIPMTAVNYLFDGSPFTLLERLPINTVLQCGDAEYKAVDAEGMLHNMQTAIMRQLNPRALGYSKGYSSYYNGYSYKNDAEGDDAELHPLPFAEFLGYTYDFGDEWRIKITATRNCTDLVESGVITQEDLDKANIRCRETYRPVTIAADGDMLLDDVGGIDGFVEFLRTLNPDLDGMEKEEKRAAREEKKEMLAWAKSQGWRKNSPWI